MDSGNSVFHEDSDLQPPYPIAPVEVQAYAYVALRSWSDYFEAVDPVYAERLASRAADLKRRFNASFVRIRAGVATLAYAIDGNGKQLLSARSSMGHCLWAVYKKYPDSLPESILEDRFIGDIVRRLNARDMFVPRAGIRTLSSRSRKFNPMSYHNGSIWPHDTAMIAEGFENFGYREEAHQVRAGLILAFTHFKTPIELFAYTRGRWREYRDQSGNGACRQQAWSAASLLSTIEMNAKHDEAAHTVL